MPTQETTGSSPEAEATGAIQSATEMKAGDRVVYPKQGVCRVLGLESKEIAGQRLEFVAMSREEDNATILVPVPKVSSIGLRKVADTVELADVFDLLASSFDDPELDWKVRHRLHGDLLAAGGILGVAEVLKALQGLANLRPLPQKERERYDLARHLLVAEVTVALGVPPATAEDFIDLALLPPPGTVRPASKPRRLAVVTPRPKPFARARPRAEGEQEEELGLEEDLGFEEEEEETGLEEEGAESHEEEAEEEAPKAAAPARAKTAAKAKAPAKTKAKKAAPATAKEAKPKAEAAKKAAPTAKEAPKAGAAKKAAPVTEAEAGPEVKAKARATKKAEPVTEAEAGPEVKAKARATKKAEPTAEAEAKPGRKGATTTKKAAPESGAAAARNATAKKAAPAAKAAPKGATKKRKSGEEA